ncbi:prohead protease/major capsid protein fusion protein [Caenimonas terrae]|uniref:Prohead protease/major capsid protein fusion protein n=1 Tax=Caenimonas terrae TaxID=696074 RepID=A0ABW0NBU9_9BURK
MNKPADKKQAADRAQADMPIQLREAQIVPASFNEAERTVDVVWTTGSRRRAYDWYNDTPYEEELAVEPDAVDMSRFEAGTVQVLDGHNMYGGVGAILGVATRGSIENGQGIATLRLSGNPDNAGIVGDIRDGIIRAISFGYSVQKYEITRAIDRTDGVNMPLYRAVAWTPQEISFVPVPADANASTRSQPKHGVPCEFTTRAAAHSSKEPTMTEAELQAQRDQEAATRAAAATAAATAAQTAERQRSTDITALCARHAVPADQVQRYIADGTTVDAVRTAILDDIATRDAAAGGQRNVTIRTVSDETQTRLAGLEEAFMHRVHAGATLTENGQRFRGMTLMEMGREHLERCNVNTRGMSRMQLATQILTFRAGASMSTSDFSSLLANVANKRLRMAYEENVPSYQRWSRRAPDAPDFKQMTVVNLAGTPDLLQVNEHGEFKYGAMSDGKEVYSLLTFGRIVSLTRQALINDDLRGFDRLVGGFGSSAARLENRTVYSILTANTALGDGVALFHATHNNLAGAGAAINVTPLGAGRAAMRVQKGLQGNELNIAPRYLIVPAAQEALAYQYTSANYVPTQPSQVNEFRAGGRTALEPIVEAVLDASSALSWYLAAGTDQVDTVEYCYLEGAAGPVVESEPGFEVDGINYKCRLDFAAKAIDYRGLYKNPGA